MKNLFRISTALVALLAASAVLAAPALPANSSTRYYTCSANLSMTVDASGQLVCLLPAAPGMVLKDVVVAQSVAGDGTSWVITPKRNGTALVTTNPGFTAAAGATKVTNVSGSPLGTLSAPTGATRPVIKKTTAATQTITVGAGLAAADVVTIGGYGFTARASGAAGYEFNLGADEDANAVSLAAVINTNPNVPVVATANLHVVTITAKRAGTVGNAITLAQTGDGYTLGDTVLAGGYDAGSSGGEIITVDVDTTGTYNTAATGIVSLVFEPLK